MPSRFSFLPGVGLSEPRQSAEAWSAPQPAGRGATFLKRERNTVVVACASHLLPCAEDGGNGSPSSVRLVTFCRIPPPRAGDWAMGDLLFASLTTSSTHQTRQASLRSTFMEISGDKNCFNEDDLLRYAMLNGLPVTYVRKFMEAADRESVRRPSGRQNQKCITYEKFSKYVLAREDPLKQMFQTLDISGTGTVDADGLEIALSHIRVKCPDSKCVFKRKKDVVHDFISSVAKDRKESFSFDEFRNFFLLLPENDMLMDYYMSSKDSSPCDIGGCVVLHKQTDGNPMGHLLAGAVSGAVSRTATAPLETLRIMAMTGSIPDGGTFQAAQKVVKDSGWRGLFRGNGVNVIRSAPQKALDFFAFDAFKRLLSQSSKTEANGSQSELGPGVTLLAAAMAGATSSSVLYPLEVVRSRITTDSKNTYRGVIHAFRKIIATEGVASLYTGVVPSIAAIIPEAAITYGMFDVLKRAYSEMKGIPEPSVVVSLAFGVTSAFMGQVVAYPLETISRRMQVSRSATNPIQAAQSIIAAGGIAGLYSGIRPSLLKVLPMAFLSFGTYEAVRHYLNEATDRAEAHQARQEWTTLREKCAMSTNNEL